MKRLFNHVSGPLAGTSSTAWAGRDYDRINARMSAIGWGFLLMLLSLGWSSCGLLGGDDDGDELDKQARLGVEWTLTGDSSALSNPITILVTPNPTPERPDYIGWRNSLTGEEFTDAAVIVSLGQTSFGYEMIEPNFTSYLGFTYVTIDPSQGVEAFVKVKLDGVVVGEYNFSLVGLNNGVDITYDYGDLTVEGR